MTKTRREFDLISSEQLPVDALRVTGSEMKQPFGIWTMRLLARSQ